jgi:hypothetical protein
MEHDNADDDMVVFDDQLVAERGRPSTAWLVGRLDVLPTYPALAPVLFEFA